MGRNNKSYSMSLHKQAYLKLSSMEDLGTSKRQLIETNEYKNKICAITTYKTYWQHTKQFFKYVEEHHPECTTLKKSRKYVKEYLTHRYEMNLSAWTIHTEAKSLGKLFGITPDDEDYFIAPVRKREDIKRSRTETKMDRHFSITNNHEFICFCKSTGLRRSEIENLKGDALFTKDELKDKLSVIEADGINETNIKQYQALKDSELFLVDYFIFTKGKGGRIRYVPIFGQYTALVIERMKNTPRDKKVFIHVPTKADIHSYRGDYATMIYKMFARDVDTIPKDKVKPGLNIPYQSEVYVCRKDEYGKRLDKYAMYLCSKALGHNRVEVVANNYIRGL